MSDNRPGFNLRRLLRLMQTAIQHCKLDLGGKIVLTEAATGAYVMTPVLAAMAGAQRVFAVTYTSRYGTVERVREQTRQLAELAGVSRCVEIITGRSRDIVAQADVITNSGHVRPIDAEMVRWMKPTAVIPLMYETWELRSQDVDLVSCRERGIAVAGTNECHPAVDVFFYLGVMAIKLLTDARIAVYRSRVLLLCDNPLRPFIEQGLKGAGAIVETMSNLDETSNTGDKDAILVAVQPKHHPILGPSEAAAIAERYPGAVVAQFWGDLDHAALTGAGVPFWPLRAPEPGHMGVLPSSVGPEPIVRLQAGGLKVGQVMAGVRMSQSPPNSVDAAVKAAVASGFGQAVL